MSEQELTQQELDQLSINTLGRLTTEKQFEDIVWFPTRAEIASYFLERVKNPDPYSILG